MNSAPSISLSDYKVTSVASNFSNMYLGDNVIYIDTNVQLIPRKQPNNFICRLTVNCVNEKGDLLVLKVIADGFVVLPNADEETATRNNLTATRLVYERTQEFFTKFKEISNVKFIDLPPFETVALAI